MRFLLALSVFLWLFAVLTFIIAMLALVPAFIVWGILWLFGKQVSFLLVWGIATLIGLIIKA